MSCLSPSNHRFSPVITKQKSESLRGKRGIIKGMLWELWEKSSRCINLILMYRCNFIKNIQCSLSVFSQVDTHATSKEVVLIISLCHFFFFLLPCRNLMPRTLEGQITMEKTPSYFITKEAPRRVFSMSRHTKLIVVVRDPVTRAVSDYTQTLSKSPGLPSFQNLAFRNTTTGLIDTSWSAVRIGIYAKHLENWLRFFPLSRLLFVSGERLVTDPAGEMGRVQDFLGLKRVVTDKHFYFNQTKGFPCLKKPEGSSRPRCLGKSKGRPHPQIPSEVLLRLRDFYRPFNLKFYQMTGHNFGWDWAATHQSS